MVSKRVTHLINLAAPSTTACDAGAPRYASSSASVRIVDTAVFAAVPGGGNRCPVVLHGESLTDIEMLAIAANAGAEAAFLLPAVGDADVRIRYFVPDHELGVSGHATIAAVSVGLAEGVLRGPDLRIETSNGVFKVTADRHSSGYVVTLAQELPVFGECADRRHVAAALGVDMSALSDDPVQSVSVSRAKLIVPLRDVGALNGVRPDPVALNELCEASRVSGVYAFSAQTDKPHADVEGRQFPFNAGYLEDAATGVAAVALAAYMFAYMRKPQDGRNVLNVAQGYAMGQPSRIGTVIIFENDQVVGTAMFGEASIVSR